MQAENVLRPDNDCVLQLIDDLLPGDHQWQSASAAIDDISHFLEQLSETDREWVNVYAAENRDRSRHERLQRLRALEIADAPAFGRVLQALYGAYYTTSAAMARVRDLASSGPTEPSRIFD